jgi:hypothetical protein
VFIKNNLYSFFRLTAIILSLLTGLFYWKTSFAGSSYSEQGNDLTRALKENLIKQGFCSLDTRLPTCSLQMYRADGKRIHLNMYGQTDTILASKVAAFLVENGIKITKGMPITLKVFSAPKTEYLGLKSIFSKNDEFLKLALNK